MKGRWESNINVWFPFMYSQKWNCYFLNRVIIFCLPVPTLIDLWEIYIFPWLVCLFCCREICRVDRSWEYINRSQTHECGNGDWGRAISRKGIHKQDLRCSPGVYHMEQHIQKTGDKIKNSKKIYILRKILLDQQPHPADARQIDSLNTSTSRVAGVLDEPYSQLTPLSGVAVQAREST